MTGTWFADAASSRVVLLGSSEYDKLDDLPAVRNNLTDLRHAITESEHGLLVGRPDEHCAVLGPGGEPATREAIGAALSRAGREATELLLVYYSGHGLVDDDGMLHLALEHTDPKRLGFTAVPLDVIMRDLVRARARARVLILDCCFSGRAIGVMAPPGGLLSGQLPASGTYVLTSTGATKTSHVPRGSRHSAFTGALLGALGEAEPLNLDQIYERVRGELCGHGLPSPERRTTGGAGGLALTRGPIRVGTDPARALRWWHRPSLPWKAAVATGAVVTVATAGVAVAGGLPWQHPRDERPTEGERTPTSSATTGHGPGTRPTSTASGASPSSRPPRPTTEELKVELFKSNRTSDGTVTIDLKGAVGAVDRGKVSEVFGGGEGQTGGGGGVRADNTNGGTASGFVNFAVDALGRTCSAHGLALGESTLVTGPTHKWAKITVVHVENATPDNSKDITATFRISQGRGETPQGNKTCA
ncbi:caspase domain-containing protein [Streptomyces sp. NPDC059590]|uniref:caspase family protein n=1 Tax=Streptomyces sp. NPDC059590 TaxID=3346877 RepID=UPI00368DCB37